MYIQLIQSTIDPAVEDQGSHLVQRHRYMDCTPFAQLYSFFSFSPFFLSFDVFSNARILVSHTSVDPSKSACVIAIKFTFFLPK